MAEGDDLDDTEYESIYGYEMMVARFTARVAALEKKISAQAEQAKQRGDRAYAQIKRLLGLPRPDPPDSPDTPFP